MTRTTRWLERACWVVAVGCGSFLFFVHSGVEAAAHAAARAATVAVAPAPETNGAVLGQLQVPRLHLTVPIIQGDDKADLLRGVGHIEGTAFPGGLGTVGLAGHRDTFLRPLQQIRPGMRIRLSQGGQTYAYLVDRTDIVHPEDVRVLDTTNTPELVVVTCYPFHYIGAAPLRFIVRAHLLSLLPEPASSVRR